MQAHQQSSTAARKQIQPAGPTKSDGGQVPKLPFQPVNANPQPSSGLPVAATFGLAHDAANLLVALSLYSDMLARPGVLRPEHAHYAKELRHLAQRSSVFMRGLIDPLAAKADPSLAVPLTDPAAVLRSLSPLLSAIAAPVASVRVTVPTSLPHISIPAESLERILINLVRNAAQAIERSQAEAQALPVTPGTVRIALTAQANNLRLTVDDNGPGMTMIDAAAFLAPSPLLPGARRGLGHRIISELVKASGGTLTVRVRPGRGTRFVILWPAGSPRACTPAVISLTGISEV